MTKISLMLLLKASEVSQNVQTLSRAFAILFSYGFAVYISRSNIVTDTESLFSLDFGAFGCMPL